MRKREETPFDPLVLESELRQSSHRRYGPDARQPGVWVIGRTVRHDALSVVQNDIAAVAEDHGFSVRSRPESPGVIYATMGQLTLAKTVPEGWNLTDLQSVIQAAREQDDTFDDPVRLVGGLAYEAVTKRSGRGKYFVRVSLKVNQSEHTEQLSRERAAVLDALDPRGVVLPEKIHSRSKEFYIQLANINTIDGQVDCRSMVMETVPLPEELVLGPVGVFDSEAHSYIGQT